MKKIWWQISCAKGLKAEVSILCDDFHCDSKSFMTIIMSKTMTLKKSVHLIWHLLMGDNFSPPCLLSVISHGKVPYMYFISESSNFISQDICIYLYTDLPWEWALVSESSNFISQVISVYIYIQIYPESELWSVSRLILYHRWYLLISIYRFTLSISLGQQVI